MFLREKISDNSTIELKVDDGSDEMFVTLVKMIFDMYRAGIRTAKDFFDKFVECIRKIV